MSTIYDVANVKGFIRMCNDRAGMSATAAT